MFTSSNDDPEMVAIVRVDALFHAMQLHMKDLGER
jgi:hypothetical protein